METMNPVKRQPSKDVLLKELVCLHKASTRNRKLLKYMRSVAMSERLEVAASVLMGIPRLERKLDGIERREKSICRILWKMAVSEYGIPNLVTSP